ncbi:MAG TPA: trypsin-like peptidase domain-containing protein [Streptosporangiaceae bacterium]
MQDEQGSGTQPPDQPGWSPPAAGDEAPRPEAEPGPGQDTPPGASWVPGSLAVPPLPAHGLSGDRPPTPGYAQRTPAQEPRNWPTTPLSGQGSWDPPPTGGYPPAGGYPPGSYGPPGGYGQPTGPPPPRRGTHPLVYVLVALLAAALGASAVLGLQARNHATANPSQNVPSPNRGGGNGNTNTSSINAQAVAAKVEPGVVDITSNLRYTGQVFEGTGIVLSPGGLVLTNNHVVDGATRLTVTLVSSGRQYAGEIVGTDASQDVALIRLVGAAGLKTVQVGNSDKALIGTQVVALGNAGGAGGPPTVTSGSITALRRTITASDSGSDTSETLHNMLQTNAPIAEGDSGGPLSNGAGQVIGIDTAANTQTLGGPGTSQGFAIPINRALAIAHQMAAGHGSAAIRIGWPAFMGVAVASSASNAASAVNTPQQQWQQLNQAATAAGGGINSNGSCLISDSGNPVPGRIAPASSGTLIAGVFCNDPAHRAGLGGGDVIQAVNGRAVSAPASLTRVLTRFHPGEQVSVTWMDTSGQRHTTPLRLIAGPAA